MARRTQSTGGDYEQPDWTDDWYLVFLNEIREIQPKGAQGPKGQPLKNAAAKVVWATDDDAQNWIWDTISLTPSMTTRGTPSKCLAIMCAIAGRDPYKCGEPWIDDETLEFGFEQPGGEANSANWPVAGRIQNGIKIMLRGEPNPDDQGRVWLRPEKYRARQRGLDTEALAAQTEPAAAVEETAEEAAIDESVIISDDGNWRWNGTEWVPNA